MARHWSGSENAQLDGQMSGGRACILVGSSVALGIALGFAPEILPVHPGLDASFIYAFNAASTKGLQWGQEFLSTYGPYGYLARTMAVGNLPAVRIAFDLFLAIASGVAVALYVRSLPAVGLPARLAMVALLHWVLSAQLFDHKLLAPLLVLVLAALHLSGWSSLASYGAASLAAGFYLLIKFTVGFGALGTVLFACVLTRRLAVAGRRLAVTMVGGTVGFLLGWLASGGTLAGIRGYVSTAYEITRGYSSAMSLVPPDWWLGVASFAVWLAGIVVWAAWQGHRRTLLTLAALSPPSSSPGNTGSCVRMSTSSSWSCSACSSWPCYSPRPCARRRGGGGQEPY